MKNMYEILGHYKELCISLVVPAVIHISRFKKIQWKGLTDIVPPNYTWLSIDFLCRGCLCLYFFLTLSLLYPWFSNKLTSFNNVRKDLGFLVTKLLENNKSNNGDQSGQLGWNESSSFPPFLSTFWRYCYNRQMRWNNALLVQDTFMNNEKAMKEILYALIKID